MSRVSQSQQSQVSLDLDRLIVEVAACDDIEALDYYNKAFRYISSLAESRAKVMSSTGFGVFLADRFMGRFDTVEQANECCISKIVSIYDCDVDDIIRDDYGDFAPDIRYWVGEKPFMARNAIASVRPVDEEDTPIFILHFPTAMPDEPFPLNYQSNDTAIRELSGLVSENAALRDEVYRMRLLVKNAWDSVNNVRAIIKDNELVGYLDDWLRRNKDFLLR